MGSEKQRGGGVGQQVVGQTQHPSRNCGIFAKGGRGKKNLPFYLRNPFLRRAQSQKLIFFCVFFAAKQHVGPGINYFRKLLGLARYENAHMPMKHEFITQSHKSTCHVKVKTRLDEEVKMVRHSDRLKALCASHISPRVKQSNQGPFGGNVQCL